jgi:hypothetical protein
MKFIGFFELKDPGKAIEKFGIVQKMKKEDYDKEGIKPVKALTPPYAFTDLKTGFQLFEADDLESLYALASFYYGAVDFEFTPFDEAAKAIEINMKVSKALS